MFLGIMPGDVQYSVGKYANGTRQCPNTVKDQELVISLLNAIDSAKGGTKEKPLTGKPIHGICSAALYAAIVNFQSKQMGLVVDGHIDPGKSTIKRLNLLAGGAAPGGGTGPGGKPGDETIPPLYASWPSPLLETIRRSYRERNSTNWNLNNGFPGSESPKTRSLAKVIDDIGPTLMDVIKRVYDRTLAVPGIWPQVRSIREIWMTSSEGFMFNCYDPRGLESLLRHSPKFCADLAVGQSMHQRNEWAQNRQCYREMGVVGRPGLHICIVAPGQETADGGVHNMHIDYHQLGKLKTKKCNCWYAGLNAHFSDVGAWIVDTKVMPYIDAKLVASHLPPLPAAAKKALRDWMLKQLLTSTDAFDTLENSIDKPPLPGGILDTVINGIIWSALKEYRQWYLNNV
jgi:hypothetical protein